MLREVSPADEKQPKVPLGLYNTWGEDILLERAGKRGEGEPSNSFSHAEHGCWTHLSNHRPQNRHIYHRSSTSHPPTEDYKTDTLQTDRRHGMLHHGVAERVRCLGVYLQTPDSLQKLQKPVLSFSAMTDANGCILPGLGGSGLKLKREIFWCLKPGSWKKLHQLQFPSNQEKSQCFMF